MRKPGLLLFLLIIMIFPVSAEDIHLSVRGDMSSLDGFFCSGKRISVSLGVRRGQVGIDMPFTYGFSLEEELGVADLALSLRLYPIHDIGLYFAADIVSWIHVFGADSPGEKDVYPSSFSMGYSFRQGILLVEPEIVFQNPARISSSSFDFLSERFLCYEDFHFALGIGLDFTVWDKEV